MELRALRALLPTAEAAPRVTSLPYDVVSVEEARALIEAEPLSFLSVDLPEAAFDADEEPDEAEVLARAGSTFRSLVDEGVLRRDPEEALYLYRLQWQGRVQTGVLGLFATDDYDSGAIARHEVTRADKEDGRLAHIEALGAQTGVVFLAFRAGDGAGATLRETIASLAEADPLLDFTDAHGVRDTLWRVGEPAAVGTLRDAVGALERAYIADGHHRSAAAVRHAKGERVLGEAGEAHPGHFLAALFPDDELTVLAYHRVVADRAGLAPDELASRIREAGFDVDESDGAPELAGPGEVGLHTAGRWWRLTARDVPADPVAALDVALLQERVLGPILGIGDPRTDPRIAFVGGDRAPVQLEAQAGGDGVAFLLYPTTVAQLMAVADAGLTMPPKSTWFEPKLRSGLVVNPVEE